MPGIWDRRGHATAIFFSISTIRFGILTATPGLHCWSRKLGDGDLAEITLGIEVFNGKLDPFAAAIRFFLESAFEFVTPGIAGVLRIDKEDMHLGQFGAVCRNRDA